MNSSLGNPTWQRCRNYTYSVGLRNGDTWNPSNCTGNCIGRVAPPHAPPSCTSDNPTRSTAKNTVNNFIFCELDSTIKRESSSGGLRNEPHLMLKETWQCARQTIPIDKYETVWEQNSARSNEVRFYKYSCLSSPKITIIIAFPLKPILSTQWSEVLQRIK